MLSDTTSMSNSQTPGRDTVNRNYLSSTHDENRIKIEGRSGCPVRVYEKKGKFVVRKSAASPAYNKRLELQRRKQASFPPARWGEIPFFTPNVHRQGFLEGVYWFDMDFISGEKYSSWLVKLNKVQLDAFINQLIEYLTLSICFSNRIKSPKEIINNKLSMLSLSIDNIEGIDMSLIDRIKSYLAVVPEEDLYEGACHGDFTLSNMLFLRNGQICIFDLLDSFIESPLIDFVKIRQDTCFKWTMHIENEANQYTTKLIQVLDYIDKKLHDAFLKDICFQSWEPYLTVLNLARILPYSKDDRDLKFLQQHLNSLLS